MTFLYGAMLAGLAALAVPVVLHLIARQRFPVQDLPTVRLLDAQRRANVLAPRLVDRRQLALRLLVVLLAVLAMARWATDASWLGQAPRDVVLVIDTSASLRARLGEGTAFAEALRQARAVIDALPAGSRCGLVADGAAGPADRAPTTDLAALAAAVDALTTIDGAGRGVVRCVADACVLARGRRSIATQVVVLSDLRASAFAARDREALARIAAANRDLPRLAIACVDLGAPADNVGVVDAYVRGGDAKAGDDVHVVATLATNADEAHDVDVRLAVADRREPKPRRVSARPDARVVVDLTTRVNRAAQTTARVEIDGDAYADDDARTVPLTVRDARRVLIVDGAAGRSTSAADGRDRLARLAGADAPAAVNASGRGIGGATILRYALNPGRELGLPSGTGIEATVVAPEALAGQPLSAFELVVLYDVDALADQALTDLRAFVEQGRALLIVAGGGVSAVAFNRSLAAAAADRPALAPARLGNDVPLDPSLGIRVAGDHPVLVPFHDPAQGDLSVVRLLALRELGEPLDGAQVAIAATDGRPIAMEKRLGAGTVMLLATGFEVERGTLARTRVFPALLWRLVDHLTGRLRQRASDRVPALAPAVLDVSEPALALAERLELTPPSGPSIALPAAVDGSVLVPPLATGAYALHRARPPGETGPVLGYARWITAHIDAGESDRRRVRDEDLAALLGPAARIVPAASLATLASAGGEATRWLLVLLALLYVVEALNGWLTDRRRAAADAAGAGR